MNWQPQEPICIIGGAPHRLEDCVREHFCGSNLEFEDWYAQASDSARRREDAITDAVIEMAEAGV